MNFQDYLTQGQLIDFELETGPRNVKILTRVEDIAAASVKLSVIEDGFAMGALFQGGKGILWGKKRGLQFNIYVEIVTVKDAIIEVAHLPSRSHLRVDAFIKLVYRPMSRIEFNEKQKKYLLNTAASDPDQYVKRYQRFEAEGTEPSLPLVAPEIISELKSIHNKLDFIIRTIGKNEQNNIYIADPVQVNLSGSGMRFVSAQRLEPGVFLDVEMILPISSGILIDLIGEVVRSNELADERAIDADNRWETAVTFAAISQDDREMIIHYIFKRQRELLRAEDVS